MSLVKTALSLNCGCRWLVRIRHNYCQWKMQSDVKRGWTVQDSRCPGNRKLFNWIPLKYFPFWSLLYKVIKFHSVWENFVRSSHLTFNPSKLINHLNATSAGLVISHPVCLSPLSRPYLSWSLSGFQQLPDVCDRQSDSADRLKTVISGAAAAVPLPELNTKKGNPAQRG